MLTNVYSSYIKYSFKTDLSNISKFYDTKNGCFWVAVNESGKVLGHIGLDATELAKNKAVELRRCSVDSNFRQCGIGKLLVNHLIEKARTDFKANSIFLTTTSVQEPAIQLYKKHGFRITNNCIQKLFFNTRIVKMELLL